mgnify:CR=1 FL=1
MIQIKTKIQISIQQAIDFEISQNEKNIRKIGMFSTSDCHWLLKIENSDFNNGFKAKVSWFQLQSYKPDADSEDTAIKEEKMFYEDFVMNSQEMNGMFNQVGISIISGLDSFSEKTTEIVGLGILFWLHNMRKVFGEGVEFEIVE